MLATISMVVCALCMLVREHGLTSRMLSSLPNAFEQRTIYLAPPTRRTHGKILRAAGLVRKLRSKYITDLAEKQTSQGMARSCRQHGLFQAPQQSAQPSRVSPHPSRAGVGCARNRNITYTCAAHTKQHAFHKVGFAGERLRRTHMHRSACTNAQAALVLLHTCY
jgi:hypothetical protein